MRMAVLDGTALTNIIEAEEDFELLGFTLVPATPGAQIGGRYIDGKFLPPETQPDPIPSTVTRRQILTALGSLGWITEEEAEAALTNNARPAVVDAVIGQLPEEHRFGARMKWAGFQQANRDDDMVAALALATGRDAAAIDALFVLAAGIE